MSYDFYFCYDYKVACRVVFCFANVSFNEALDGCKEKNYTVEL